MQDQKELDGRAMEARLRERMKNDSYIMGLVTEARHIREMIRG